MSEPTIPTTPEPAQSSVPWMQSASTEKLDAAFIKAQREMGSATKDSKNPHFRSTYADLASVIRVVKPALNNNDLGFRQFTQFDTPQGLHRSPQRCSTPVRSSSRSPVRRSPRRQTSRAKARSSPTSSDTPSKPCAASRQRTTMVTLGLGELLHLRPLLETTTASRPRREHPQNCCRRKHSTLH